MAKKSKGKSLASSLDASLPSPSPVAGTSTALASSTTTRDGLQSSTGSIASTSTSSQLDSSVKEVRAVEVTEDEDAEELPEIQVNKWSLHDLKTACDDAVKQVCIQAHYRINIYVMLMYYAPSPQYFSKPSQFKPSHVHTDVRLTLGWTASILAIGASLYAYKVPFQQSRDYVLAAVVLYIVLSIILAAYVKYVEKDTIFEGRRKVFAGRVCPFYFIHGLTG